MKKKINSLVSKKIESTLETWFDSNGNLDPSKETKFLLTLEKKLREYYDKNSSLYDSYSSYLKQMLYKYQSEKEASYHGPSFFSISAILTSFLLLVLGNFLTNTLDLRISFLIGIATFFLIMFFIVIGLVIPYFYQLTSAVIFSLITNYLETSINEIEKEELSKKEQIIKSELNKTNNEQLFQLRLKEKQKMR